MTTTSKTVRTCFCGETFDATWKYGVHIGKDHPDLRRGGSERCPLRTVSCWACAKQIDVNVTKTCSCGFSLEEAGY